MVSTPIYLFRDSHFAPTGDTLVCLGQREVIEAALGPGRVQALFKGAVTFWDQTADQNYLGVWGNRNASRLRRLLGEHGVEILIRRTAPPHSRLRYYSTQDSEKRLLKRNRRNSWKPSTNSDILSK